MVLFPNGIQAFISLPSCLRPNAEDGTCQEVAHRLAAVAFTVIGAAVIGCTLGIQRRYVCIAGALGMMWQLLRRHDVPVIDPRTEGLVAPRTGGPAAVTTSRSSLPQATSVPQLAPRRHRTRRPEPAVIDGNTHEGRIAVMRQTLGDLRRGEYTSPQGVRYPIDYRAAVASTQRVSPRRDLVFLDQPTTTIIAQSIDCLYAAERLYREHSEIPFVLNMANDVHPGGGYLHGAGAQEEDLCRRSGLSPCLDTRLGPQTTQFYPINGTQDAYFDGLYSSHVPVFRAGRDRHYDYLEVPFPIAVGTIAALIDPPLLQLPDGGLRLHENPPGVACPVAITKGRIRTLLQMAAEHLHKDLVLGALGCGAFRNPPNHIAELMLEVIREEFPRTFRTVVFAITEDRNCGLAHNPEGNFLPFARAVRGIGGRVLNAEGAEIGSA